ncbi:MAG: hypothetical protein Ta2B_10100 [Termitinemataceae bacterium]|nr:MAG: hypothetical protein Ta2B_10100 [Termitinemataceae bacterium]
MKLVLIDNNAEIRLSSKADAQTYIHEKIHALARTLSEKDLERWDNLETGIDLKTAEGQEDFVDLILEHLRAKEKTGVQFFDDIIEIIKYYIEELRRKLKDANVLTPEVKEYLDGLLSDPDTEVTPEWNNYFKGEGGLFAGADSADNVGVDAKKEAEYKEFVKDAWQKAVNHKTGEEIPHKTILVTKDNTGADHILTTHEVRHVFKQHGNPKKEQSRGQLAIKENDFYKLKDIIENPTFVFKMIKYRGQDSRVYVKHTDKNSTYVLGVDFKNKQGKIISFFQTIYQKDVEKIKNILKNDKNYDLTDIKIENGLGSGGNPTGAAPTKWRSAVANSADPADTSLSTQSAEKSRDISEFVIHA